MTLFLLMNLSDGQTLLTKVESNSSFNSRQECLLHFE